MNRCNLVPLKFIKIITNVTVADLALSFNTNSKIINEYINGKNNMSLKQLQYGLSNMNISLDDYLSLQEFGSELDVSNLSNDDKYKYMIIKTLSILSPSIEEYNNFSNEFYNKQYKKV